MHMALGTSGCSWLDQDSALALLSANRIQGKETQGSRVRRRGLLSQPSSPTMLPSRGFQAFGDRSHPLLSCPISGPRGTPQRGERDKDQLGLWYQGLALVQTGNRINQVYVASGSGRSFMELSLQNRQLETAVELRACCPRVDGLTGTGWVGGASAWMQGPACWQPRAEAGEAG